ncbi:DUF3047 domain-containing protein [bacterium]|nr:MAG: DUF3047 domain-containing protein [bacterium]
MDLSGAALGALVLLSSTSAAGWEPLLLKKVPKATAYAWDPAEKAVRAESAGSASGLVYKLDADAAERPLLRWRWKVAAPLASHAERARAGDDFAARVYVTFRYDPKRAGALTRAKYALAKALYGEYPPHGGLAYVWSSSEAPDAAWPNPYTGRVRMVAVRSGAAQAGTWAAEERDILADYRAAFGEDPPPLAGVALMTDTDQTGAEAKAWYADVTLAPRPR